MSVPRAVWLAILLVAATAVVAVASTNLTSPDDSPPQTRDAAEPALVVTSPTDDSRRLTPVDLVDPGSEDATLTVDVDRPQQTWWGTGAALTDASVQLIEDAPETVDLLFDPDRADGARLDALRLPLTSTDFSPTPWTWGWDGSNATPSGQAAAAIATLTERIEPVNPDLRVLASPWSAPPSMKSNDSLRGGALADDAVKTYAAMLSAQARELLDRGVPLEAVTLGNEPNHASDYPTMTMSVEQMSRLGGLVQPELPADVGLLAGDDNWEHRSAFDRLAGSAPQSFDGTAYHCYEGSPDQMDGPTQMRLVSECSGTDDGWRSSFAWQLRNLVATPVEQGSSGLLMWNLALDEDSGPQDPDSRWGCGNCRGLLTVEGTSVTPGPEFYLLAHLTRAAPPQARVVPVDSTADDVVAAAFRHDDGTVGVVGVNDSGESRDVSVDVAGTARQLRVGPGELFTYTTPRAD